MLKKIKWRVIRKSIFFLHSWTFLSYKLGSGLIARVAGELVRVIYSNFCDIPTFIGEENECQQGHWVMKWCIVRSHIDWREKRVRHRSQKRWIVRLYIGWRGEQIIFYRGVETSHYCMYFKNLEWRLKRESPKMTISDRGRLGRLHLCIFNYERT